MQYQIYVGYAVSAVLDFRQNAEFSDGNYITYVSISCLSWLVDERNLNQIAIR